MNDTLQRRALNNDRKPLNKSALARFEVFELDTDRDLIRSLARILSSNGPESACIDAVARGKISAEPAKRGGIIKVLRRSPLVGANLDFGR